MSQGNQNKQAKILKIITIGMSGVGKTSFITRFAVNEFQEQHLSTIGVDFRIKDLNIDDEEFKLQMWDTAGQERFRSIANSYYRNANGLIFVMDPTQPDSLQTIARLLEESNSQCSSDISKILITTKNDLGINSWQTDVDAIEQFAEKNNMSMFRTSAKTGENVELAVESLIKVIKVKMEMKEPQLLGSKPINSKQQVQKKEACYC